MYVKNCEIREARADDCEQIIGLIQELADFEKQPNSTRLTPEVLRNDGFGPDKMFRCFVLEDTTLSISKNIVGFALYFFNYSTWEGASVYLEDLYVTPSHRHHGLGTLLWRQVAKVAVDRKCNRLDWVCLDWNTEAMKLYRSKGAVNLTEKEGWHLFRLKGDDLKTFGTL